MALCGLVMVVLALPLSTLAFDRVEPPLERTTPYKLASHVALGQVTSLRRLDRAGKPDSAGPRFSLDLAVSKVLKTTRKDPLVKGKTVSVLGWATGDQKTYLPRVKEEVLAFLKGKKDGACEALEKTGLRALDNSTGRAAGPDRPKKKK
jgi:hypothetical protein